MHVLEGNLQMAKYETLFPFYLFAYLEAAGLLDILNFILPFPTAQNLLHAV